MITYLIVKYCDFMICTHNFVKKMIIGNDHKYLLEDKRTRREAWKYLQKCMNTHMLYCTRPERHRLYKLLKGKDSPFIIESFGREDRFTRKQVKIIQK
jgi:hypothetical protein